MGTRLPYKSQKGGERGLTEDCADCIYFESIIEDLQGEIGDLNIEIKDREKDIDHLEELLDKVEDELSDISYNIKHRSAF